MIFNKLRGAIFLVVVSVISVILFERPLISNSGSQFTLATQEVGIVQTLPHPISRQPLVAEILRSPPSLHEAVSQDAALNINETLEFINSLSETERLEAIQNLGANPNQAAETLLTQELIIDQDARVRNAAARSLGIINTPSDVTIQTLLDALEDESEAVCLSALLTLQLYIIQAEAYSDNHSTTVTNLKFALEAKVLSDSVSKPIQQAITKVLETG